MNAAQQIADIAGVILLVGGGFEAAGFWATEPDGARLLVLNRNLTDEAAEAFAWSACSALLSAGGTR